MVAKNVRDFAKRGDAIAVPTLTQVQRDSYERFLQLNQPQDKRNPKSGLEALLREVFPIQSYDGTMRLEYLYYKLDEARYTPDECRELRLTYGMPFRIGAPAAELASSKSMKHIHRTVHVMSSNADLLNRISTAKLGVSLERISTALPPGR